MKISIGIPAYNEAANIASLIENLLGQHEDGFELVEIIVVSDLSTDGTDDIVRSFTDERIQLIVNTERLGASLGQNKILDRFTGDVLVLLNADVLPVGPNFLTDVVRPFSHDRTVGLLSPNVVPLPAQSFFERVINHSVTANRWLAGHWNHGDNFLACKGAARAFSKSFAEKFRWPKTVGEDAYSYFTCRKLGYRFVYLEDVAVWLRSPQTFADHRKQSARFAASKQVNGEYLSTIGISNGYRIPLRLFVSAAARNFFANPLLFCAYAVIQLLVALTANPETYRNPVWSTSESSKRLGA